VIGNQPMASIHQENPKGPRKGRTIEQARGVACREKYERQGLLNKYLFRGLDRGGPLSGGRTTGDRARKQLEKNTNTVNR